MSKAERPFIHFLPTMKEGRAAEDDPFTSKYLLPLARHQKQQYDPLFCLLEHASWSREKNPKHTSVNNSYLIPAAKSQIAAHQKEGNTIETSSFL